MIDPKILDDLSRRISESLPAGFRQVQADLEKTVHALLQAAFAKLDLVTREEFDVQQGVLARTRTKVEDLEKQMAELESRLPASARGGAAVKQTGAGDKAAE